MIKQIQIRQGDVLVLGPKVNTETREIINDIPAVPGKLIDTKDGRTILAYGETTGHFHSLPSGASVLTADEDGNRGLQIKEASALTHDEHDALRFATVGNHTPVQQCEWTSEGIEAVRD